MLSPSVAYLRIKLANEMSAVKPDSGASFSAGIKPEDDLAYDVMAKPPGMPMAMSGDKPRKPGMAMSMSGDKPRKPEMLMSGDKPRKPGMGMGGKPGMGMGGKPGMSMKDQIGMALAAKPGMSMKDQIGMALAQKSGTSSNSKDTDTEITPDEMEASNVAEQSSAAPRLPGSMGFLANTFR